MNYVTLFDRAYLRKGLCLLRSMEKHLSDYSVYVLPLDDKTWEHLVNLHLPNVHLVRKEFIESGNLVEARKTRTHQEYCWLLASYFTHWCMTIHELDNVIYVDADSWLLGDPQSVLDRMGNFSVAIPPHRFAEKDKARLLPNGIYNVNFVVFRGAKGLACLREWKDYCLDNCYYRNENGHFADQACWDWLLAKHNGLPIDNIGVNVAPWNSFQYKFGLRDGKWHVNHLPLVLMHFHELQHDDNGTITRLTGWTLNEDILPLYEEYQKELWNAL